MTLGGCDSLGSGVHDDTIDHVDPPPDLHLEAAKNRRLLLSLLVVLLLLRLRLLGIDGSVAVVSPFNPFLHLLPVR